MFEVTRVDCVLFADWPPAIVTVEWNHQITSCHTLMIYCLTWILVGLYFSDSKVDKFFH